MPKLQDFGCFAVIRNTSRWYLLHPKEVVHAAAIFFVLFKAILFSNSSNMHNHSNMKLMFAVAHYVLASNEDRACSLRQPASLKSSAFNPTHETRVEAPVADESSVNASNEQDDKRTLANNFLRRFKKENIFSHQLGKNEIEYLSVLEEKSPQLKLFCKRFSASTTFSEECQSVSSGKKSCNCQVLLCS